MSDQIAQALPCKEMCSVKHFNGILIQSYEKCITYMVLLCMCLKQIRFVSGFKALMIKYFYPSFQRFVAVGLFQLALVLSDESRSGVFFLVFIILALSLSQTISDFLLLILFDSIFLI